MYDSQGRQSVIKIGGGANAEEVWGTDVSQRGPGAEPLVGVWGLRPEAKGY